jgi:hypothetical protein
LRARAEQLDTEQGLAVGGVEEDVPRVGGVADLAAAGAQVIDLREVGRGLEL